jgi:homoserine kinase
MGSQSVLMRAPGTIGNFGGATNCAALALDAPLNVKVTPRLDGHVGLRYFGPHGERVPRDRSNLVVRALEAALHLRGLEFTGADFEIYSSLPVAVGLGSSTAAVLAGLLAADRLFRLGLDEKALFELATICEPRQDSLQAAWLGGFVVTTPEGAAQVHRRTVVPENFTLSVVMPEAPPASRARRQRSAVRPAGLDAAAHLSRAETLAEFFGRPGDGRSPWFDTPLPPTCQKQVPGLEDALGVRMPGMLALFVCGSGPAVGILAEEESAQAVAAVRECFARRGVNCCVANFRPTNAGAREWNGVWPQVALPPLRARASAPQKPTFIPV